MEAVKLLLIFSIIKISVGKALEANIVECDSDVMKIVVPMEDDKKTTYLDQLKDYEPCKPVINGTVATFLLDIEDPHTCGVTRVVNQITGKRTFYRNVVVEDRNGGKEMLKIKCSASQHTLQRRDTESFPLDFKESDNAEFTGDHIGHAPEPILGAIVKQNGRQVSGEISVSPGTPLSMEVSLDDESAPVYGLLVSYMHVTDAGKQQETIIFNGCSVDPYLFDNFATTNGDVLSANFKAFKFPDSTYVQFKCTVSVCIDMCPGVQCSNGAIGYGRRRRSVDNSTSKLYEVALSTFIKVNYTDSDQKPSEDIKGLFSRYNLQIANQKLGENEIRDEAPTKMNERSTVDVMTAPKPGSSNIITSSCLLIALGATIVLLK